MRCTVNLIPLFFLLLAPSSSLMAKSTIVGCQGDCKKTIEWTGCGISKKGFMLDLADAFGKKNRVTFDLSGGGATKGIRDVVSKKVQFGGLCRLPLTGTIKGATEEAESLIVPVAWDALVVITHKGNPINDISSDELRAILTGKITKWEQLKKSQGKQGPFNLYVRTGKISGVGRTLRQVLFQNNDLNFSKTALVKASSGIIEKAVATDKNAIAVTGFSSAKKRDNLKILKLDGVENTVDSLKKGDYPIYRMLFLTFLKESLADPDVMNFVLYTRSLKAIKIMRKNNTVPFIDGLKLSYSLGGEYLNDILKLDAVRRYNPQTLLLNKYRKQLSQN